MQLSHFKSRNSVQHISDSELCILIKCPACYGICAVEKLELWADKWDVWLSRPLCDPGASLYNWLLCRRRRQVTRRGGGAAKETYWEKKGEHENDRDIQRVEKTKKKGGVGMKANAAALSAMWCDFLHSLNTARVVSCVCVCVRWCHTIVRGELSWVWGLLGELCSSPRWSLTMWACTVQQNKTKQ